MTKRHAAPPNSAEFTLSSSEVCRITHVTMRQLQWWDEHGIVSPTRDRRNRSYRSEDVLAVLVAAELRQKGLSLQKIRQSLRPLRREMPRSSGAVLAGHSEWFLVTDGQSAYLENSRDAVIDLLRDARRPMWLISVSQQSDRLRESEEKVRLQRAARPARKSRAADKQMQLFR